MINDRGKIPPLRFINIDGKKMYYAERNENNLMKIFRNAVGISEESLLKMDNKKEMFFRITFDNGKIKEYICKVNDFINSKKRFMNAGYDKQKFVSIHDMKNYIKKPFWM